MCISCILVIGRYQNSKFCFTLRARHCRRSSIISRINDDSTVQCFYSYTKQVYGERGLIKTATQCYGTVVPLVRSAVYGMYTSATLCPPSPIVFVCRQRAGGEEGLGRRQPGTSWLNAGDEKRYPCVNTKVSRPNRLSVSSLGRRNFQGPSLTVVPMINVVAS